MRSAPDGGACSTAARTSPTQAPGTTACDRGAAGRADGSSVRQQFVTPENCRLRKTASRGHATLCGKTLKDDCSSRQGPAIASNLILAPAPCARSVAA